MRVAPDDVGEGVPSRSRVNVGLGERKGSREACRGIRSEAASRGVTPRAGVLCVAALNRSSLAGSGGSIRPVETRTQTG